MVMVLRIPAPPWDGDGDPKRAGKCTQFPRPMPNEDPWFDDHDEAIQVCNGDVDGRVCPLREQCLLFALVNNEFNGIWGGTYEHDRIRIRRTRPRDEWTWEPPTPKPGSELFDLLAA